MMRRAVAVAGALGFVLGVAAGHSGPGCGMATGDDGERQIYSHRASANGLSRSASIAVYRP